MSSPSIWRIIMVMETLIINLIMLADEEDTHNTIDDYHLLRADCIIIKHAKIGNCFEKIAATPHALISLLLLIYNLIYFFSPYTIYPSPESSVNSQSRTTSNFRTIDVQIHSSKNHGCAKKNLSTSIAKKKNDPEWRK